MASKSTASWNIQLTGHKRLKKALRVLGEREAPFLKAALEEGGGLLRGAAAARATGGISSAVQFVGVQGSGGAQKAIIRVKHPGARSMEFGRKMYYRGFRGRQMKATGQRFRANRGQQARPYMGIIKNDAAIGQVGPQVKQGIEQALEREWERIGREPE
ncbi:MAG TPA: hypothetical protein VNL15_06115 [Dehalococcoidia bacterium]|nr:hypothetical protein [Dehalococcoidia bacterium]